MSENSSSPNKAQQKQNYENFLKELPGKCSESKFTTEQIDTIVKFAKEQEPNLKSQKLVIGKLEDISVQNGKDKEENYKKQSEAEKELSEKESKIEDSEDFKDYLRILAVTGEISGEPSPQEKVKILDQYEVWVKDGRPKPSLGENKPDVEEILRIYRRKWKGKQYISFVVKGKSEQTGMKTDITYGKLQNGMPDKTLIIGRTRYPHIEWTNELAKEVLEKAKRYTEQVQLRFVFLNHVVPIHNEKNFFGDFDKLIEKGLMKQEVI